jgi:hypothetical protein
MVGELRPSDTPQDRPSLVSLVPHCDSGGCDS